MYVSYCVHPFLQLITGIKMERPNLEIGQNLNHVMQLGQAKEALSSIPIDSSQEIHHRPLITDRTVQAVADMSENVQYPEISVSNSRFNNNASPIGLPDLNVSAQESSYGTELFQPLDLITANKEFSREMASLARKRRMEINRVKNSIAANRLRYPHV